MFLFKMINKSLIDFYKSKKKYKNKTFLYLINFFNKYLFNKSSRFASISLITNGLETFRNAAASCVVNSHFCGTKSIGSRLAICRNTSAKNLRARGGSCNSGI